MKYLVTAVMMTVERKRAGKSWTELVDTSLIASPMGLKLRNGATVTVGRWDARPEMSPTEVEALFERLHNGSSFICKVIDVRQAGEETLSEA
jgi:hypothetical protein